MEGNEGPPEGRNNNINDLEQSIREEIESRQREGLTQDEIEARNASSDLPSAGTSPESTSSQETVGRRAVWKNADYDQPIVVVGSYGVSDKDGKEYLKIEGTGMGVPADEVEYEQEHPQVEVGGGGGGQQGGEFQAETGGAGGGEPPDNGEITTHGPEEYPEGDGEEGDEEGQVEEEMPEDMYGFRNVYSLTERLGTQGNDDLSAIESIRLDIESQLPSVYGGNRRLYTQASRRFESIFDPRRGRSIEEVRDLLKDFIVETAQKRGQNIQEGNIEISREIESIQDLAKFIMRRQESEKYGFGKQYALLTPDGYDEHGNEILRFNHDNFLIWVRDRIIQLHDDNRTTEMHPLSAVAIETDIRNISIYMMSQFRGQYFRDERTGEILHDLADEAVNMCYLFGFFRNMHLFYGQAQDSDEKLPGVIMDIHARNDVTHGANWADFLSMPDRYGTPILDEHGNETGMYETTVGDAELIANDIYYNLSDLEELENIVGVNSPLMTKEGFKRVLLHQQSKFPWEISELESQPGFYDKVDDNFYVLNQETGEKKPIFNSDGTINVKNYLDFINFENVPTPDKSNVDFVRELIRQAIARKTGLASGIPTNEEDELRMKTLYQQLVSEHGENDGKAAFKREIEATRINVKFAEYSAYIQQRPLLVAARNDINRRGFDAATKLDVLNYALRQSGENTAGPIGNPELLLNPTMKNLSVDFVAGLRTESNKSPYEIFREIRHVINNDESVWVRESDSSPFRPLTRLEQEKRKKELLAELRFKENAAKDYSANSIKRAFDIFHSQLGGKELGLEKLTSRNAWGKLEYETAAFDEAVKEGWFKGLRYAISSNAGLKFGSMYRSFQYLNPRTGMPVYREETLAEHMFGEDVISDIRKDAKNGKFKKRMANERGEMVERALTFEEYLNTGDARIHLLKNAARARAAAEIRHHTKYFGTATHWNADIVNKFIRSLETIHALGRNPDNPDEIIELHSGTLFSPEDIAWIRMKAKVGYVRTYAREAMLEGAKGIGKGVWDGFGDFFEDIFEG